MNSKTLVIIMIIFTFSFLHSVQVKKKEVRDYNGFEKGLFEGTGLKDNGELFISLKSSVINGPDKEYYLGSDISKKGDLYIGTGHSSSLFRIEKNGKITEMFKAQEPDIYAVLYGSDNSIYVGSSPRGKLFKITDVMKSSIFFNPDEKYIWDLKEDKAGNIICAVGGSGGVYKIDKNGNSKKIFSGDTHIISLCISSNNSILAGSGGSGILYQINSGKNRVIFDTPFEEVNGIYEDKDGDIWFSASREVKKWKAGPAGELISIQFSGKKLSSEKKSTLYLKRSGGEVEKMWSSSKERIYSVTPDKKNGGVLIGTGDRGRIYRIKKDKSFSLIYEGDSAQTYKILQGQNSFIAVFNNTSSIIKLDDSPSSGGSYKSDIFNLGIQSRTGRLYWDSTGRDSSAVSLFIRSGNTSSPDTTWTEWSPPFTDSMNSNINRSGYKYFQVKINLNSSLNVKSPMLSDFRFFYIEKNLKPEMKSVHIKIPIELKKGLIQKKSAVLKKDILKISWRSEDPNKDKIKYSLFLKKISGTKWIRFKKDLTSNTTELDTTLYEDGEYILKIVADDSSSNSPDTFKTDTIESKKFTIDSTAPVLSNFRKTTDYITFKVTDNSSLISKVQYSFTGEKWFPLDPVDGINDSNSEEFKILKKFTREKRVIFLKITDEYKNSKVFQREL